MHNLLNGLEKIFLGDTPVHLHLVFGASRIGLRSSPTEICYYRTWDICVRNRNLYYYSTWDICVGLTTLGPSQGRILRELANTRYRLEKKSLNVSNKLHYINYIANFINLAINFINNYF